MSNKLVVANLEELIKPLNITQRMFVLALVRGLSVIEAHDFIKGMGANIDRSLVDPKFNEIKEFIENNVDRYRDEGRPLWRKELKILGESFQFKIISKGLSELDKEQKDLGVIKLAAGCANALRESGMGGGGSYDEVVLKKHREL